MDGESQVERDSGEPEVEREGGEPQVEIKGEDDVDVLRKGQVDVNVEGEGEDDVGVLGRAEGEAEDDVGVLGEGEDDVVVEGEGEGHDEYDVRSWNGTEEDVLSEDDVVDVNVHGDEVEDDLCESSVQVEVGGSNESSTPFQHVHDMGLFDTEWEYETLGNVVLRDSSNDDKEREKGKCPWYTYFAYKAAKLEEMVTTKCYLWHTLLWKWRRALLKNGRALRQPRLTMLLPTHKSKLQTLKKKKKKTYHTTTTYKLVGVHT
ncbi:hypothetical protein V8G54_001836 [Vigna mungo]|uniref:Uncharacterized protein n=1 Tax=Vigna mungo TaxID=3915 RepID=A0AAQ3P9C4_VIGMU